MDFVNGCLYSSVKEEFHRPHCTALESKKKKKKKRTNKQQLI